MHGLSYACHAGQAKDMVGLVNKFAAKLEDKKGALSEDEVLRLRVLLNKIIIK